MVVCGDTNNNIKNINRKRKKIQRRDRKPTGNPNMLQGQQISSQDARKLVGNADLFRGEKIILEIAPAPRVFDYSEVNWPDHQRFLLSKHSYIWKEIIFLNVRPFYSYPYSFSRKK
jgi:hypothetical protein